jgi:predicted NBD/HSP70 family sugar kinase
MYIVVDVGGSNTKIAASLNLKTITKKTVLPPPYPSIKE